MKRFISGIIMICMVVCMIPIVSHAETFLCDGLKYEIVDGYAVVTGRSETLRGDIVIPSVLDGYDVIGIGRLAFGGTKSITSVVISEGIEYIDEEAFRNLSELKTVVLPNSMTNINNSAFYGCVKLESINLHDGITNIGSFAFENCYALKNITIPNRISEIKKMVFTSCHSLETIVIPDNVTCISDGAFADTGIVEIIFPDTVVKLGDEVLYTSEKLDTVVLPNHLTVIPRKFASYSKNLRAIYIPKSVENIGQFAFCDCNSLSDIYYEGSEKDWLNIDVAGYNDVLFNATIHYNSKKSDLIGEKEITVNVNGKEIYFDVPPIIENGRTLVPVRAIFEAMGMEVTWDNDTRTVVANGNGNQLILPVGSYIATVNGRECALDVPAKIVNGRTLVPVRFIAESVGATVLWDNENRKVLITY